MRVPIPGHDQADPGQTGRRAPRRHPVAHRPGVVYVAGGIPAVWRALAALWQDHGPRHRPPDGRCGSRGRCGRRSGRRRGAADAVSVSTTLGDRALGRARRAVESLIALRSETAFRRQANGTLKKDYGSVEGVEVTCDRCGHSEESFGAEEHSLKRCAYLLHENCPRGENNFL